MKTITNYHLVRGDTLLFSGATLASAINLAKQLLEEADGPLDIVIKDDDDEVLGVATNRRIVGRFDKSKWVGARDDTLQFIDSETFDATDAVLRTDLDVIQHLEDRRDNTEGIGRECVSWDGPCDVVLVQAVKDYFGVDDVYDITDTAFDIAKAIVNPPELVTMKFTVNVVLTVSAPRGTTPEQLASNLKLGAHFEAAGMNVVNCELQPQ